MENRGSSTVEKLHSSYSQWVKKDLEVVNLNFSELMVVSRLFTHNNWKEINDVLEENFKDFVSINHFMENKALLSLRVETHSCLLNICILKSDLVKSIVVHILLRVMCGCPSKTCL